jgi:D-glycero-alpha-D-manno-heptose-7-phosphate kinase
MIYRARAPFRISFCGGGTDVSPYPEMKGGCVLSVTIDRYSYVSIDPRKDNIINIKSLDYGATIKFDTRDDLLHRSKYALLKYTIKHFKVNKGANFFIHSDVPPGSGLGASSTIVVTLIGAIAKWKGLIMTPYEIAELAFKIEREELGIKGGRQDQYSAVFGGFNFIEFLADSVVVNTLRIDRDLQREFHYHLLLCDTKKVRFSSKILARQIEACQRNDEQVMNALEHLKILTIELKNALLKGDFYTFGRILDRAWEHKKKLAPGITSPAIDEMYEAAKKHGAIGGKLLGAGGGGHLLLFCPYDKKDIIAKAVSAHGAQVVHFNFDFEGMRSWCAK